MTPKGWKRLFIGLATLIMVMGVAMGALAGGVAGFVVAQRSGQAQPVSLIQPASSAELPIAAAPTQPTQQESAPATQEPTQEPTVLPEAESAPVPDTGTLGSGTVVTAVEHAQPATVLVMTTQGAGSGAIISDDGYIVTNSHVVQGSDQFIVVYDRGERVEATLVGDAPDFDLAVLKVDGDLPAVASWGDASAVPLGSQVIAIGSALGSYQNSVTVGILSGVNRELGGLVGLLQHDASINHGNSGGPLLNEDGQIIGINTMMVRGGQEQAEGLSFAIPSNIAQAVVGQLIEHGEASRPIIGVSLLPINSQVAQQHNLTVEDGAYIEEVMAGSPGALAGVRAGDVVVAVNGKAVTTRDTLQLQILSHAVGETVTLTILRDGTTMDLPVTLAASAA